MRYPTCPQVACLDTAFHRDLAPAARRLPIPAVFDAAGVRRYGFHGLSFEYLVHRLGDALGARAVLAHLGNGASLAAVRDGVGVDTTMGLTPTGGLVMGTRTGDLDPGVVVHLARSAGLDADGLERVADEQSGLLGVSQRSGDVRDLLEARAEGDRQAALALEIYETVAAKHVAALTTVLGGLDTIVFTAGVGEHAAETRAAICARLTHLGVVVDDAANATNEAIVSSTDSGVTVRVEPTNEELMMALHAARLTAS
jgi:acetate kinase